GSRRLGRVWLRRHGDIHTLDRRRRWEARRKHHREALRVLHRRALRRLNQGPQAREGEIEAPAALVGIGDTDLFLQGDAPAIEIYLRYGGKKRLLPSGAKIEAREQFPARDAQLPQAPGIENPPARVLGLNWPTFRRQGRALLEISGELR